MKRTCREPRVSLLSDRLSTSVLRHARIVTDPTKLRELYEEAAKRKLSIEAARPKARSQTYSEHCNGVFERKL